MATLITLKRRIRTARNVSKTTKAMQMISASKLKRAQERAVASKPYVERLEIISKNLSHKIDNIEQSDYMKKPDVNAKLIVVMSPDKGLCGGLITNLTREVLRADSGKLYFITVGKKAESIVTSTGKDLIASFPFGSSLPLYDTVYPIQNIIDEYFLGKKVSEVQIITTKFVSVFSQNVQNTTLLPINIEMEQKSSGVTLFEPVVDEILPDILQHYIEMLIYQNLLESYASEQAARMIAMKNATDNALDIIDALQLEYNKTRQEKITNELLDIGGGLQKAYA